MKSKHHKRIIKMKSPKFKKGLFIGLGILGLFAILALSSIISSPNSRFLFFNHAQENAVVDFAIPAGTSNSDGTQIIRWTFGDRGTSTVEGWKKPHDMVLVTPNAFERKDGYLRLLMSDTDNDSVIDPYIFSPSIKVNASATQVVEIRMKIDKDSQNYKSNGQIYWITNNDPYWGTDPRLPLISRNSLPAKTDHFDVYADGEWHIYNLPVGSSTVWKDQIVQLRIDPAQGKTMNGKKVLIDYIAIVDVHSPTNSPNDHKKNGESCLGDRECLSNFCKYSDSDAINNTSRNSGICTESEQATTDQSCSSNSDCSATCGFGCVNNKWWNSKDRIDCTAMPQFSCECVKNTCIAK